MRILFQGDSITDCGRDKNVPEHMGRGYPLLVNSALGFREPGKYEFINRGISGNRITDLYTRIKKEIINLEPDVMSILIGVNDVWHDYYESPNGVATEKYFKIYCMLIEEVMDALPDMKIMIFEPFVLKASATEENWDEFRKNVEEKAAMAKKVAEKYNLTFIPLQETFDKLCEKAPADYWLRDGVHPTAMGHEFIKNEWIKAFDNL